MIRRPLQLLASLVLVGVFGCYSQPLEGSLTGQPESAVRSRLGQSDHEFAGHYGAPPLEFTRRFAGPVKTSVFKTSGGNVYVSFEKRNGIWTAICDSSLPGDAAF